MNIKISERGKTWCWRIRHIHKSGQKCLSTSYKIASLCRLLEPTQSDGTSSGNIFESCRTQRRKIPSPRRENTEQRNSFWHLFDQTNIFLIPMTNPRRSIAECNKHYIFLVWPPYRHLCECFGQHNINMRISGYHLRQKKALRRRQNSLFKKTSQLFLGIGDNQYICDDCYEERERGWHMMKW